MSEVLKPNDLSQTLEIVQGAVAAETPLETCGHGSKRALGRPSQSGHLLDMSACSGVTLYEPEELVLSAKAGTPVAEIETLLAASGQELAFEPIDYTVLLGGEAGGGTLGGLLAANLSGPRRIKSGAARDHILGVEGVSGRGEAFKSGGRVVKNVTGYDLSKGMAGSWGTLAVLTDLSFKVLPRAEASATVSITGLNDKAAGPAMSQAMGSTADVSAAAHLPAGIAALTGAEPINALAGAVTLLRVEGFSASVTHRAEQLTGELRPHGSVEIIPQKQSENIWRALRDCVPLAQGDPRAVWRISTAPTAGPELMSGLAGLADAAFFYDWAGGLIWLAVSAGEEAEATAIRAALESAGGGHATLVRAAPSIRARVPVFQPQERALAALSARLKQSFDPLGILNPGRMYAGV